MVKLGFLITKLHVDMARHSLNYVSTSTIILIIVSNCVKITEWVPKTNITVSHPSHVSMYTQAITKAGRYILTLVGHLEFRISIVIVDLETSKEQRLGKFFIEIVKTLLKHYIINLTILFHLKRIALLDQQ